MTAHRRLLALSKDCVRVGLYPESRHQVFKQGSRPGEQNPLAVVDGMTSAQTEPALLPNVSLRDGDESCGASLGGEQVIARRLQMVGGYVISDGEKLSRGIVEEAEIHFSNQGFRNLRQPSQRLSYGFSMTDRGLKKFIKGPRG